jgi:hypothetical protein
MPPDPYRPQRPKTLWENFRELKPQRYQPPPASWRPPPPRWQPPPPRSQVRRRRRRRHHRHYRGPHPYMSLGCLGPRVGCAGCLIVLIAAAMVLGIGALFA